jgi:hypothetical protein
LIPDNQNNIIKTGECNMSDWHSDFYAAIKELSHPEGRKNGGGYL